MDVIETNLVVIGSGPAGYAAAFRAKDLGVETILVERYPSLGGVCLNVGCIPSKSLLSVAEKSHDANTLADKGMSYSAPKVDQKTIQAQKDGVVKTLSGGLAMLAKKRRVQVLQGDASFVDAHQLQVGEQIVQFKHAIIATGSEPNRLPFLPDDPRIFDSTGALELKKIEGHLVIIGGGIIGCEMATIYKALGASVTVLEVMSDIMMGADPSHAKICQQQMENAGIVFKTGVSIDDVEASKDHLSLIHI